MPHAAAPPSSPELSDDRSSSRCLLDEIGAATVLGAMVEHRRYSSSSNVLSPAAPSELEANADDADAVATQRRPRLDPSSDLFQKIR